jgi:hypothetical protein
VNVTGTAPQAIFGSTLDSGKSAGLAGYSSLIQLTNVNSWLTSNNYDSLKITVYYAGYGNALVHDNFSGMSAVFFDGLVTTANAATFASTTSQVGLSSVSVQGSGPYYGIGSTVELSKGSISDNILIATQLSSNLAGKSSLGGIAAIKFEGVTAVPEPSTYALMGAVVAAGLAVIRRRRKG